MAVLYFIVCILRPICIPIPEIVIVVWGNQYLSDFYTYCLGVVGSVIGIVGMYLVSGIGAEKIIQRFHYEKPIEKYRRYIDKYSLGIIGVFFVLPIFSDIIISLGAAIMKVNISKFTFLALISKIASIGIIIYSRTLAETFKLQQWQILLVEFILLQVFAVLFQYIDRVKYRNQKE